MFENIVLQAKEKTTYWIMALFK